MAEQTARVVGCPVEQVLVASTGVIGVALPMDKVRSGIPAAFASLGANQGPAAARAIMTTDISPKEAAATISIGGRQASIGGMCKGAGMIEPMMATMLGFLTTDAAVPTVLLDRALREAVDQSFNAITVDGDSSTNDCVLLLASGASEPRKFSSGPTLTAEQMVQGVKKITADWKYDAESIGFPGPVLRGRPVAEPHNLGKGWVGFDFKSAFGCPVKLVNDAAMQALGSYKNGKMLFLGLGTGLGSAMIVDGIVEPMELGHLPYKRGTYESHVGKQALMKIGTEGWGRRVADVVALFTAALEPDEVVLGGGNVKRLRELPPRCRAGDNRNAFLVGFRLWEHCT